MVCFLPCAINPCPARQHMVVAPDLARLWQDDVRPQDRPGSTRSASEYSKTLPQINNSNKGPGFCLVWAKPWVWSSFKYCFFRQDLTVQHGLIFNLRAFCLHRPSDQITGTGALHGKTFLYWGSVSLHRLVSTSASIATGTTGMGHWTILLKDGIFLLIFKVLFIWCIWCSICMYTCTPEENTRSH